MTIKQLQAQLARLVAADRYMADATVTFGAEFAPVEGGIMARSTTTGLVVLNLAQLKLDKVGGF